MSDEKGRIGKDVKLSHAQQVEMANTLKGKGYANASIAHIMRINKGIVRILLGSKGK